MPRPDEHLHQRIQVGDGDGSVSAEIVTAVDRHGTAHVVVHSHSGHLVPGLRRELIDRLLDLPETRDSKLLAATVPLGDAESLLELTERCEDVVVHAAGSSALIDARLHAKQPGDAPLVEPKPIT